MVPAHVIILKINTSSVSFKPKSITCNRTKNPLVTVTENGNQLVISNKIEGSNEIINRPFVEKGLGVEEHDVRIYHKDQLKSCVRMQRVKRGCLIS